MWWAYASNSGFGYRVFGSLTRIVGSGSIKKKISGGYPIPELEAYGDEWLNEYEKACKKGM